MACGAGSAGISSLTDAGRSHPLLLPRRTQRGGGRVSGGAASKSRRSSWTSPAHAPGQVAAAAEEVSVDGEMVGRQHIVAATDPGYAVNPAQIERQITGSFVYGLSALFYGECTVKDGHMERNNAEYAKTR